MCGKLTEPVTRGLIIVNWRMHILQIDRNLKPGLNLGRQQVGNGCFIIGLASSAATNFSKSKILSSTYKTCSFKVVNAQSKKEPDDIRFITDNYSCSS